jgi:hypothetical protein
MPGAKRSSALKELDLREEANRLASTGLASGADLSKIPENFCEKF